MKINKEIVMQKDRILIISQDYPYPINSGNKRKLKDLLSYLLSKHYLIDFIVITDDIDSIDQSKNKYENINFISMIKYNRNILSYIKMIINGVPLFYFTIFDFNKMRAIRKLIKKNQYKMIISDTLITSIYLKHIKFRKKVLIINDSSSLLFIDSIRFKKNLIDNIRSITQFIGAYIVEKTIAKYFHKIIVVSHYDRLYLKRHSLIRRNIHYVPISFGTSKVNSNKNKLDKTSKYRLIYWANLMGHELSFVKWFDNNVFTKLNPEKYELIIIGKIDDKLKNHIYQGYVEHISDYITDKTIFISPIFKRHGQLLKLMDAINMELPICASKESFYGYYHLGISGLKMINEPYNIDQWVNLIKDISDYYSEYREHTLELKSLIVDNYNKDKVFEYYKKVLS